MQALVSNPGFDTYLASNFAAPSLSLFACHVQIPVVLASQSPLGD